MINETPPPPLPPSSSSVIPKVLVVWFGTSRHGMGRCGVASSFLLVVCMRVYYRLHYDIFTQHIITQNIECAHIRTHYTYATVNLGNSLGVLFRALHVLYRHPQTFTAFRQSFIHSFLTFGTDKILLLFCMRLVFPICFQFVVD